MKDERHSYTLTAPERGDIDLFFWLGTLTAAAIFLLRFGYDFGISDQDEFLPYLAHLLDPDVLANDWFVGIQTSSFNVRTAFVHALLPIAALIGAEATVHAVYAASFAGVCLGVYRIGLALHRSNPVLAAAGVVLAVALTARWNPGGNDVAAAVLAPSIPAWAFALNGLATVIGRRLTIGRALLAAVLISLATAMQGLVGLQVAALSAAVVLVSDRTRMRAAVVFIFVAGAGALLAVAPLIVGSGLFESGLFGGSSPPAGGPAQGGDALTPAWILAVIRAPHHYLPAEFGVGRWARLWLVVLAGITLLWRRPDVLSGVARNRVLRLAGVILVALLVFRIWIAADPLGPAVLLQPFKMTVLLRVLCAVAAVGWLHGFTRHGRLAVTAFTLPAAAVVLALYTGLLDAGRLFPFTERHSSPVGDVHAWIRSRTPDDAVFAIPPGHTGFSWSTHRAQFVNFKAVPYTDDDLRQWLDRLRTVAPFEPEGVGGTRLLDDLDRSYHSIHPSRWQAVMAAESIDYVLARRGEHFAWPASNASYCNEDWCVYSGDDMISIDEWRYATD